MLTIPFATWIANAAAALTGTYGAVTRQAAGRAAGRVLKVLDARCRVLVLVGCLDEIFFHGRPVLVGVEPASMAWFLGQKAIDRTGATWAKALRDWDALSYVTADAGTGLQVGIAT